MAGNGRKFSKLSPAARSRAARAGQEYGLTRRQVRERYNRGTFNPFARSDPSMRVPAEYRSQAVRLENGQIGVDWAALAQQNMISKLGDYFKWSEDRVVANIDRASPHVQRVMAMASESEIIELAYIQSKTEAESIEMPYDLLPDDIGYYKDGEWRNIFWYH
jgi:hypothetical protein